MQDDYDFILVRGTPRYRYKKKIVGKNKLPRHIMERYGLLNPEEPQEEDTPEKGREDPKGCLFCGVHSRFTRFVNLQTVYLCDSHYYDVNIGKVAQRLRELKEAQHA